MTQCKKENVIAFKFVCTLRLNVLCRVRLRLALKVAKIILFHSVFLVHYKVRDKNCSTVIVLF